MQPKGPRALVRSAILFGSLLVGYLAARATGSAAAFAAVMAVGLLASLILLARWR